MNEPTKLTLRESARRARVRSVRAALITAAAIAGAAYAVAGDVPAQGVLLGGIAGTLGFWTMSVRLEQIAFVRPERLPFVATAWTFYRLIMYAAFLAVAYQLDREEAHGLLGGVAGLLSTRVAITLVAIRQAKSTRANAKPRA